MNVDIENDSFSTARQAIVPWKVGGVVGSISQVLLRTRVARITMVTLGSGRPKAHSCSDFPLEEATTACFLATLVVRGRTKSVETAFESLALLHMPDPLWAA